jgi:biuret amidohydrolase
MPQYGADRASVALWAFAPTRPKGRKNNGLHISSEVVPGWREYCCDSPADSVDLAEEERPVAVITVPAEPAPLTIDTDRTALVAIDMQRDFLEPGGFGAALGNDVARLAAVVDPLQRLLRAARAAHMLVIHTREGHRPDLSDAPRAKVERGAPSMRIGDPGPMGRILVRGEPGHDIVPPLYPAADEPVIDKPGKGAFYATDLHAILVNRGIEDLIVCGVTTEVCVHTTVREANDRGFRCLVPDDCCGSYFPEFHIAALAMIKAQGGIFGWVARGADVRASLGELA